MASANNNRLSREDWKKAKELEELRKAGVAPAETDEDGKMINPHIPQYVSQAPWYLNSNRPGLKHQYMKHFEEKDKLASIKDSYDRTDIYKKKRAKKFRKGACENCGAMTHKRKDCMERPRRKSAKVTNTDIAPDEKELRTLNLAWDGKRDRYNGYNPAEYKRVIQHYENTEKERRAAKAKELDEKYAADKKAKEERRARRKAKLLAKQKARLEAGEGAEDSDSDTDTDNETDDEDEDEDLADFADTGGIVATRSLNSKMTTNRTTSRNLRIREDTAKYLHNLNMNSAYYDPKTRSMRANPHPDKNPSDLMYAGDNFVRKTGDAQDIAKLQSFVWDASDRGNQDVHVLANPTQSTLMHDQFRKKKELLKKSRKEAILAQYGGEQHLEAPDKSLLMAQSEAYAEYTEGGELLKGQEKLVPSTKYIENHLEHGHKAVWGSYWEDGSWGYACCRQTLRSAYCTGEAGIKAVQNKALQSLAGAGKKSSSSSSSSSSASAAPASFKQLTVKQAEKKRKRQEEEGNAAMSRRKGNKGGGKSAKMSEKEEMEEYLKSKSR